jgi:hypothetical protein
LESALGNKKFICIILILQICIRRGDIQGTGRVRLSSRGVTRGIMNAVIIGAQELNAGLLAADGQVIRCGRNWSGTVFTTRMTARTKPVVSGQTEEGKETVGTFVGHDGEKSKSEEV